jgi:exodeoxyribonuclease V beta subunit
MKRPEPFDLCGTPLAEGITVLEASAGTGKTYTIAGLVVRLIVERGLTIQEILVSTYTELATAELRDRIRRLLRNMEAAFAGEPTTDSLAVSLFQKYGGNPEIVEQLRAARQDFDEAPIYTIHGFCQRVLQDRTFETGSLFDAELVTDQSDILREVARDYWRAKFYEGDPLAATLALCAKISSDGLFQLVQKLTQNPLMRVIPSSVPTVESLTKEARKTFERLVKHWRDDQTKIRGFFDDLSWGKNRFAEPERVRRWLAEVDECLSGKSSAAGKWGCLAQFRSEELQRFTRAKAAGPKHPFFDECGKIHDIETRFRTSVEAEFLEWAREELGRRKVTSNILSFDDMLTRLYAALRRPDGKALARSIRAKFKAALLDEFQDTDPVQYGIFSEIYNGSDAVVAYIGDPKQAIYGFRGADVHTYMRAAAGAKRRFTLPQNWRSESALVEGVNQLFSNRERPFVIEGISFDPVQAGGKRDATPLKTSDKNLAPLKVWFVGEDEPMNASDRRAALSGMVATEIVRLLKSDATIGGKPVTAGDLAVLVNSNSEARIVESALADRNVPTVLYSSANVFESHEACELQRILAAVAQPGNERLLRGALATDALGLTASEIEAVSQNETAWNERALRFQRYHEVWRDRGFVQMMGELALCERVRPRLLALRDGERRLTNFLQLTELLQSTCAEHRLGAAGLLKWLAEQVPPPRKGHGQGGERVQSKEYELRLERDENAVKIITIHKSKGLEFGIVFCPFAAAGRRKSHKGPVLFHDEDGALTLDLDSEPANEQLRSIEALSERVRLFYVAVTRARHRCHFIWGNFDKGRDSAPAYLFSGDTPAGDDVGKNLTDRQEGVSVDQLREEFVRATRGCESIELCEPPTISDERYEPPAASSLQLEARQFRGKIDGDWAIGSFSRLTRGHDRDLIDEDASDTAPAPVQATTPGADMFSFPRGMSAGTCLHQVLERVDLSDTQSAGEIVRRRLAIAHVRGFDDVVTRMVENIAAMPLPDGFTLSSVRNDRVLRELEFHFPVGTLTPARLAVHFASDQAARATISQLRFSEMRGLLKGFIDLVFEHEERFYIVDWKSNFLGNTAEDYGSEPMAREMARHAYGLQAAIYTVALDRFLRNRLGAQYDFEERFGGVYYIFLRGIDPARSGSGVHRIRPSAEWLGNFSRTLEGK